ncbi:MAG: hypothetical protein IKT32_02245 [Clostridia bacterium]|nr:hypothetical protein [Clostridia bacterium]
MWRVIGEIISDLFKWLTHTRRTLDTILENQKNMQLDILRMKFLQLVQHNPNERAIISSVFDEYKKLGGDSWVDDMYETWLKKQKRRSKRK